MKTALGAATSAVGLNSKKLTSVADPTSPQDAATKNYTDGVRLYHFHAHADSAAGVQYLGGADRGAAAGSQVVLFTAVESLTIRKMSCVFNTAPGGVVTDTVTIVSKPTAGSWGSLATACAMKRDGNDRHLNNVSCLGPVRQGRCATFARCPVGQCRVRLRDLDYEMKRLIISLTLALAACRCPCAPPDGGGGGVDLCTSDMPAQRGPSLRALRRSREPLSWAWSVLQRRDWLLRLDPSLKHPASFCVHIRPLRRTEGYLCMTMGILGSCFFCAAPAAQTRLPT